ncbi:MAG: AAA family ATPase [bacterium]|nr:AAA family ATPase [bacterium]
MTESPAAYAAKNQNGIEYERREPEMLATALDALAQALQSGQQDAITRARADVDAALPVWTWAVGMDADGDQSDQLTGERIGELTAAIRQGPEDSEALTALKTIRRLIDPDAGLPAPVRMSEIGEAPARAWLIDQWLPRGRIGMLTAEGGFGKSRLALQLAAAMTTGGGEWMPSNRVNGPRMPETAAGVVIFATWEDEPEEFKRRIGRERAAAMQDCHIVDLARFGPLWGAEARQVTQTRGDLLTVGRWLRSLCEQLQADLLIVDSLAGAFGSNEIDRAAVRQFMADWDGWGRSVDCAVMLISHPSQSGAKQAGGYSGSTDWHGASRWRWNMETEVKDGEKRQLLKLSKANYAQDGARVYIERGGKDKAFDWCEAGDQTPAGEAGQAEVKRGNMA